MYKYKLLNEKGNHLSRKKDSHSISLLSTHETLQNNKLVKGGDAQPYKQSLKHNHYNAKVASESSIQQV